jgi:hypothetical protein
LALIAQVFFPGRIHVGRRQPDPQRCTRSGGPSRPLCRGFLGAPLKRRAHPIWADVALSDVRFYICARAAHAFSFAAFFYFPAAEQQVCGRLRVGFPYVRFAKAPAPSRAPFTGPPPFTLAEAALCGCFRLRLLRRGSLPRAPRRRHEGGGRCCCAPTTGNAFSLLLCLFYCPSLSPHPPPRLAPRWRRSCVPGWGGVQP